MDEDTISQGIPPDLVVGLICRLSSSDGRIALCQAVSNISDREDALEKMKSFIRRAFEIKKVDEKISDKCVDAIYDVMIDELVQFEEVTKLRRSFGQFIESDKIQKLQPAIDEFIKPLQ